MKSRVQRIHFVGIGGIGMSGIAEVLANQGYQVSGSDASDSAVLARLRAQGVRVAVGHQAKNLEDAQAVVVSSAVPKDNPEVEAARKANLPIVPRAMMLAELMRGKQGVAIAGTHGKTTTTSLVAAVLAEGGLDPTFVVGGRVRAQGTNAKLGSGEYFVAEADESDASFLHLTPTIAVVTNVDLDHMETYGHSPDRLYAAFADFANRLPFYGALYACIDDAGVRAVLPRVVKPVVTYGFDVTADVRAESVHADANMMRFVVKRKSTDDLAVTLNLAGKHNVLNALAAIGVAQDIGVDAAAIQRALANFGGVGRRFERHGPVSYQGAEFELIDDYGHHPVELAATIDAARNAYPNRRIVLAFQPHRYTRTRDLFDDFSAVLSGVDVLLLSEVYAAGEAPIVAADSRALARSIRLRGRVDPIYVESTTDLPANLMNIVRPGDVVMTMGAGSIGGVAGQLKAVIAQTQARASGGQQ
ncbi:MAG: UDP-N-acetylmuramate--L-alanine ligase [Betaproteobacteria bacterium]|nr:MAG: UDP-N-acetylmuramate--L-alanine ligase [Betaproteobacteria bacterium]